MTAPDAKAIASELLKGLLKQGWQPDTHQPDDCGEYSGLLTPIWDAWCTAESQEAGTGYRAARAEFVSDGGNGKYVDLMIDDKPAALPGSEDDYSTQDYVTILSELGYTFALNECDDRIEVNDEPLSDILETTIRTQLRDLGLHYTTKARDAYIVDAAKNSYHPIKRYLESLAWDGRDHIGAMTSYFRDRRGKFPLYFRRWVIGAVAKAYEAAQNRVLVLDGPQGLGKSYWTQWLASPLSGYYVESPIDPSDKDHHIRLIRNWIWEVGEFGSTTRKADREALKYFVTMRWVTVRKPYDRHDVVKPALASFIGTVNQDSGFLNDPTGSRRFMATTLDDIDWNYTSLDVNQLWAQAYALYCSGETWKLTPDEATCAAEINAEYEIENPLEDLLRCQFEIDPARADWTLTTVRILDYLHMRTGWRLTKPRTEAAELASALRKAGIEKKRVTDPETRERLNGYVGIRIRR